MKTLSIAAGLALALAVTGVNAQDTAGGSAATGSTIGGIATSTIAAGVVGVAVAGAVISNNRGSTVVPGPGNPAICNPGDGEPVNGVCTGTTSTVTVTGTGTNTHTVTVPVTFTYLASSSN